MDAIDDPARRGAMGARQMVEGFLERIAPSQERVNAFLAVTADSARREAEAADEASRRGGTLGALNGVVVGIKDDIDVRDVACTVGSGFFRDRVAREDAAVVRRLRAEGAVIVGKLGLSEFALGSTGDNVHFGPVRNPWDPERYPGGSSSGPAAALAEDLCVAAIGSDAGGSIRVPAALCGVTGLRPTQGSISAEGTHQVAPVTETVGPLARSAVDVARVTQVIRRLPSRYAGDELAALAAGAPADIRGLRVGLPTSFFFEDVEEDVVDAVRRASDELAERGADVRDIDLPGAAATIEAGRILIVVDAYAIHEARLAAQPEGYGDEVRERMLTGAKPTGVDVTRAHHLAIEWTDTVTDAFADVDVILTPTTPTTARPFAGSRMLTETAHISRLAVPFSLARVPALSFPCGVAGNGLPIGAQVVAPRWHDDVLLRVACAYQQATHWHRERPPAVVAVNGNEGSQT
jgi:aspartyl-tRNA(Asn)/glutamyl-tRNA(Gln) amidotransferase subunit A